MIVGKNNVLQWFNLLPSNGKEGEDFTYWTIYKQGGTSSGYFVDRCPMQDGLTKQESAAILSQVLNLKGYGKYTITAQASSGNRTKGSSTTDFEIPVGESNNNTQSSTIGAVSMVGYISKDEAAAIADERFKKLMLEQQVSELTKRNKELETENKDLEESANGPMNQIMGMVMPMIGEYLKPVAVAQVGTLDVQHTAPTYSNEQNEDVQKANQLSAVLEKVEELFESEPVAYLEKLMNFLQANPMYIKIIKTSVK